MGRRADLLLYRYSQYMSRSYVHPPLTPLQAKNIVNYLRTIHRILTPGGVWINCGPLLWHFENSEEISIEVSLEEVKSLAIEIGFVIGVRLLVHLSASPLQIQGYVLTAGTG